MQIGDTVGDYQIIGVLGEGGMGKVFRVRNLISEREEAMKVVLPELEAGAGFSDRFLREIKVHASLEHPNVARLRTALRVGDRLVMILELVEGQGLDQILRRGPIPLRDATVYVDQVLSALSYAHARGVVHRDLKPPNIMITTTGQAKLTDFGVAQADKAPRLTRPGMAVGSLRYMSPEQVRSGPVDARSDIYSLGATFFEMLTGKAPFESESEYELMKAQLELAPPSPVDLNPALPPWICEVILRALAKDPAGRFQSAEQFRTALRTPGSLPPLAGTRAVAAHPVPAPAAASVQSASAQQAFPQPTPANPVSSPQPVSNPAPALPKSGEAASDSRRLAALDPAVLRAARQRLAVHIGPIAGVIVDRAAKKARTPQELYQTLAAEIASEADRKVFLALTPR